MLRKSFINAVPRRTFATSYVAQKGVVDSVKDAAETLNRKAGDAALGAVEATEKARDTVVGATKNATADAKGEMKKAGADAKAGAQKAKAEAERAADKATN